MAVPSNASLWTRTYSRWMSSMPIPPTAEVVPPKWSSMSDWSRPTASKSLEPL